MVRLVPEYRRHPVVADANVLFQDTQRYAKTGFTVLTFLARNEVITLLTSEHVYRRLPEIMSERAIDASAQRQAWKDTYLPLVRFVEVPDSMCAGHQQIESVVDKEDRPFARLAIAIAPSLLLTRDHHLGDVGLGTTEWADALTILGDLVELDVSLYGSAHTALILARVMGLLVQQLWRAAASQPLLSIAAAGIGLLLLLDNQEDVLRKARAARAVIRDRGSRLLEASTPVFERWEAAKGGVESRLEKPMLPRSIETVCARELATQRAAVTTEMLLSVCESVKPAMTKSELVAFLRAHPSFHGPPVQQRWELGRLGSPIIDV
ncbi:MAG TPA: hypothetical protein VGI24_03875 [Solirubrobacteraceae bacterium]|jgi:hypothetical protein